MRGRISKFLILNFTDNDFTDLNTYLLHSYRRRILQQTQSQQ